MSQIKSTVTVTIDEDGTTSFELIPGAEYLVSITGTFGSGNVGLAFVDGLENSIDVPAVGSIDSSTPLVIEAEALLRIAALSAKLNLVLADSTNPDLDVTVTRVIQ